jgi:uncharacterized protein YqjF (DUF2071 family)
VKPSNGPPPEPVSTAAPGLRGRVILNQNWRDLTFLHWAVDPQALERYMPRGVVPDTFQGRSYVGLIPFRMVDSGIGRGPGVPWLGTFLETNVRLYSVDTTGRRGIVFLSLDADRAAVFAGARLVFGLPYRWSRMRHSLAGDVHTYDTSLRLSRRGQQVTSHVSVRIGAPRSATPLDEFLSARWGLHVERFGRTSYVPNRHPPWAMRDAEILRLDDGLVRAAGLGDLASRPPDHVAFSDGVHTEFGIPRSAAVPREPPEV